MIDNEQTPLPFKPRRGLARGVVIFPSLITASALFLGFYSIIFTLRYVEGIREASFSVAVYAIILAGVLDNLDGRIARLMKAESAFGLQFDSIADMVSFGVAPAVMAYGFALIELKRWGWLGAFLFLTCAAIRLARFNVLTSEAPSRKYFKGLSSPVAAGGLGVTLLMMKGYLHADHFHVAALIATLAIALLMVSNVRFRSFKDLNFKRQPIQYFLITLLLLIFVIEFGTEALFFIFVVYLLSGLVEELVLFRRRRKSDPSTPFLPFGDR